jgi:ribosome biogenesis protein SSF1/2
MQESNKNSLRDFVHVAGPLGISHLLTLGQSPAGINFRIGRMPRGPTVTFRVLDYTLMHDVRKIQKRPRISAADYQYSPLVVTHNLVAPKVSSSSDYETKKLERALKLTETAFQNMFPPLKVEKADLNTCRRLVLLQYNPELGTFHFRHYSIVVVPANVSKGVKKLLKSKPAALGRLEDISQLLLDEYGGYSESEGESEPASVSSHPSLRKKTGSSSSNIRLKELGPRMTLSLLKIEEGLSDGAVLYHSLVHKSEEEERAQGLVAERKRTEKAKRKAEQAANVERKKKKTEKGAPSVHFGAAQDDDIDEDEDDEIDEDEDEDEDE